MVTAIKTQPSARKHPLEPEAFSSDMNSYRQAGLRLGAPRLKLIGVTSSIRGEGRTTAAIALARIQADDYGRRVALLDLDFDAPSLSTLLGVTPWPGVAELLRDEVSLDRALQTAASGLFVIPSGAIAGGGPSLATRLANSRLIDAIASRVDVIVADLPPIAATSYGRLLASLFPSLVLIIRAGSTPLGRVKEAVRRLDVAPAVILIGTRTALPNWMQRLLDV